MCVSASFDINNTLGCLTPIADMLLQQSERLNTFSCVAALIFECDYQAALQVILCKALL